MKKAVVIMFILGSVFTSFQTGCFDQSVSKQEFNRAHKYLNKRVDTLSHNQRVMIKNQKVLHRNQKILLDSIRNLNAQINHLSDKIDNLQKQVHNLEVGQYVIYDAITSPQPSGQSKNKFLNLRKWFSQWKTQE